MATETPRCSYGDDDHPCPTGKFPPCVNCHEDIGCPRCRGQQMLFHCKKCTMPFNAFRWYRENFQPRKEWNPLAVPGTTRFTPSGFPAIVEGDGWLRAVRIDAIPLRRKVTVNANGAYLDAEGRPVHPEEWDQLMIEPTPEEVRKAREYLHNFGVK